ncbi:unnamed protein product [Protopolystoma xenopodis]|uniref:Uncharacterized protein n=1 Tax=Protopolystoma xenopodis TaxID=117903 RepID=A0A3S5BKJ6_9PLAT|nr:unnamed protein product [Protopolystoma xenopodis]
MGSRKEPQRIHPHRHHRRHYRQNYLDLGPSIEAESTGTADNASAAIPVSYQKVLPSLGPSAYRGSLRFLTQLAPLLRLSLPIRLERKRLETAARSSAVSAAMTSVTPLPLRRLTTTNNNASDFVVASEGDFREGVATIDGFTSSLAMYSSIKKDHRLFVARPRGQLAPSLARYFGAISLLQTGTASQPWTKQWARHGVPVVSAHLFFNPYFGWLVGLVSLALFY